MEVVLSMLLLLVFLACAIGMGISMLFMARSQRSPDHGVQARSDARTIETLRAENAELKAEVKRLRSRAD